MQCLGTVQRNTVILEEGVYLPDGTRVTVTVEPEGQIEKAEVTREDLEKRRALVQQMKTFGQRLAGRHVNLGELALEGRQELEDHV